MKINFNLFVLALSLALFSCNKTEVSVSEKSSITNDGIFSGKIVNYSSTAIDSIKSVKSSNSSLLDKSKVTTDGKFSMSLSTPILRKIGSKKGIIISDTTALIGNLEELYTYKNGSRTGVIRKCNFTTDSVNSAGMSNSAFIYADRAITVKGTELYSYTFGDYSENSTLNYNITLKKGWNELVVKIDAFSQTTTSVTSTNSATNIITSDLQWRYFEVSNDYDVKQKAKRQSGLKSLGLLR